MTPTATEPSRQTQAERRARTKSALFEAAARGLSRDGYGNLVLERVAREAGYSRGALYHLFASKEELVLSVVEWIEETWWAEMSRAIAEAPHPLEALKAVARTHAVFCRRDIARVRMVLSIEFSGQDHPVGRAVQDAMDQVLAMGSRLVTAGRKSGTIPPGPPPKMLALAVLGAVEGLVINLAGKEPYDEQLAEKVVEGLLSPMSSRPATGL
jgi:AcrR family transcriptional regulator